MANPLRVKTQNIAVFGASGSGKTVLVSSFYGATQEAAFQKSSLYHVFADDTGRGNLLFQNYLGMKNAAEVPSGTKFAAKPYSFTVRLASDGDARSRRVRPFDAIRLVWHDYPGEWFEEDPSSEEEVARRLDTFRSLLTSDVAFILVDGQKLLDHAGEEEKYLKSLIHTIKGGIWKLKDELLDNGVPLKEFPRIWTFALSKADLHPTLDAHGLRDLLIQKAAGDIGALGDLLKSMVELPDALSIGEDFLLLSSAKFEPDRIEVTERVGVDLILPIACLLPLERILQWLRHIDLPAKAIDHIADNADDFAEILVKPTVVALLAKVPKVGKYLSIAAPALAAALRNGMPKIKELNERAKASHDNLTAVMSQFQLDLDQGVADDLLVKRLQ